MSVRKLVYVLCSSFVYVSMRSRSVCSVVCRFVFVGCFVVGCCVSVVGAGLFVRRLLVVGCLPPSLLLVVGCRLLVVRVCCWLFEVVGC